MRKSVLTMLLAIPLSAQSIVNIGPAPLESDQQPVVPSANPQDALGKLRKAAESGNAYAQRQLGLQYFLGHDVALDNGEAVKWFQKAAEQGDAAGQYFLGMCYQKGIGINKDLAGSAKWLLKAAEQGLADAQYRLGLDYDQGRGVAKDDGEAVKWFQKAADQGNVDAQKLLATRLASHETVTIASVTPAQFDSADNANSNIEKEPSGFGKFSISEVNGGCEIYFTRNTTSGIEKLIFIKNISLKNFDARINSENKIGKTVFPYININNNETHIFSVFRGGNLNEVDEYIVITIKETNAIAEYISHEGRIIDDVEIIDGADGCKFIFKISPSSSIPGKTYTIYNNVVSERELPVIKHTIIHQHKEEWEGDVMEGSHATNFNPVLALNKNGDGNGDNLVYFENAKRCSLTPWVGKHVAITGNVIEWSDGKIQDVPISIRERRRPLSNSERLDAFRQLNNFCKSVYSDGLLNASRLYPSHGGWWISEDELQPEDIKITALEFKQIIVNSHLMDDNQFLIALNDKIIRYDWVKNIPYSQFVILPDIDKMKFFASSEVRNALLSIQTTKKRNKSSAPK